MPILLPVAMMLMQSGIDPSRGGVPGVPEELRNRPPRGAAQVNRAPASNRARRVPRHRADGPRQGARAGRGVDRAHAAALQRTTGRHCLGVAASNQGDWTAASERVSHRARRSD